VATNVIYEIHVTRCKSVENTQNEPDLDEKFRLTTGFSRQESEEVWREQGRLCHAVLVKMRIRHLSEGAAFGSQAFLEEVFHH